MVTPENALPGRLSPIPTATTHAVLGTPLHGPWPDDVDVLYLAMGCFWGAERLFWTVEGVHSTAVGYMGGWTPNPTYEETCTAKTGHTESVLVAFRPENVSIDKLLKVFWENHDPTTANRQGNDVGTQYRSALYPTTPQQLAAVRRSAERYAAEFAKHGLGPLTTEIAAAECAGDGSFYYAEEYHQQYLHKNPNGYCTHGPNGISCPVP